MQVLPRQWGAEGPRFAIMMFTRCEDASTQNGRKSMSRLGCHAISSSKVISKFVYEPYFAVLQKGGGHIEKLALVSRRRRTPLQWRLLCVRIWLSRGVRNSRNSKIFGVPKEGVSRFNLSGALRAIAGRKQHNHSSQPPTLTKQDLALAGN
jgi:hypothetical protein